MIAASREGQMAFRAVEGLTKGLEVTLPEGHSFLYKDRHTQYNVRIPWWDGYDNVKLVFFGHYWMTGQPVQQSSTAACVDYSAAKEGPLAAYRWDGEPQLNDGNFVNVG